MHIPGIKEFSKIEPWIKEKPEDFVVEEIDYSGKQLTVDYSLKEKIKDAIKKEFKDQLHVTLVKKNYTTNRAIKQISSKLRIGRRRIGYAGTKDKKAITAQRISIWNIELKKVKKIKLKDITLKNFKYSNKRLSLGNLEGNRFTITVRPLMTKKELQEKKGKIEKAFSEKIPNYFGPQRFGIQREVNHLIGKELSLGNLERATKFFLTYPGDENYDASKAREFTNKNWGDFKEAITKYPRFLGLEVAVLNSLVKSPKDFGNALQKIPKKIRKIFVHSYQSYLFNSLLKHLIEKNKEVPEELPLVGYESELSGEIKKFIEKKLKQDGLSLESFKLRRTPKLAEKGLYRESFVEIKDFKILEIKDNFLKICFTLDKGVYATTALMTLGELI